MKKAVPSLIVSSVFVIWAKECISCADKALAMANLTLGKMAAGGIYDHIGGGFAR